MIPIILGALGFAAMLASDWAESRNFPSLHLAGQMLAFATLVPAFIALCLAGPSLGLPLALRLAGAILALPALYLLARSLVFDLRVKDGAPRLVETGTYALCRHPGVLWLFSLHAALILASASSELLAALPVWTGLNLALILIEDRRLFPRTFGKAYEDYAGRVPFLIPSRTSLARFFISGSAADEKK